MHLHLTGYYHQLYIWFQCIIIMVYYTHIIQSYSIYIVCLHVRRVNPLICSFPKKNAERLWIRNQRAINMVLYLSTTSIHRCILTLSRGMVRWNSGQVGFRFFLKYLFRGRGVRCKGKMRFEFCFRSRNLGKHQGKHRRMHINAYHISYLYIHLQNLRGFSDVSNSSRRTRNTLSWSNA